MPLVLFCVLTFFECKHQDKPAVLQESREAKSMLQGIWKDSETDDLAFRVVGDSLIYPDSASIPIYFSIVGDSLCVGGISYAIIRHTDHLLWFENQMGDVVKLVKIDDAEVANEYKPQNSSQAIVTEYLNRDSVVMYDGERYHWYITINPTKHRVIRTNYNDDGLAVQHIYFDNIIHLALFHGNRKVFSDDLKKARFNSYVPADFLQQAVLGDIQFNHADNQGFHFDANICIPDDASCYLVGIIINTDGKMSMKLLER